MILDDSGKVILGEGTVFKQLVGVDVDLRAVFSDALVHKGLSE